MWKDIVQYGNITQYNIKWLLCNLYTASLHALSAKTVCLGLGWNMYRQTMINTIIYSFLCWISSILYPFLILHLWQRKQHVSWRLSYLEMSRFHFSMSSIKQFFKICLHFVELWWFSIKQPLIVFNVMSQNDITKIDNHWKAKQMLPRKTKLHLYETLQT